MAHPQDNNTRKDDFMVTIRTTFGDIKLELRERLGGVAFDYLRCKTGERLIVESRDDEAMPEGTPVNVTFDPQNAYFFDVQTEERLR